MKKNLAIKSLGMDLMFLKSNLSPLQASLKRDVNEKSLSCKLEILAMRLKVLESKSEENS